MGRGAGGLGQGASQAARGLDALGALGRPADHAGGDPPGAAGLRLLGFPARYYQTTYPAPAAPDLAARLRGLLAAEAVADAPERGLDHGAYVPLVCMYPEADVPVLQVSLPTLEPAELFRLGRALAPLRQEGV